MKGGGTLTLSLIVSCLWCIASAALAASEVANAALLTQVHLRGSWSLGTPENYSRFVDDIRAGIVATAGGKKSNGIPVLLSKKDPTAPQKSLNITLSDARYSVNLKLDVSGLYFSGYVAGKYECHLKGGSGQTSPASASCYNPDPWGNSAGVEAMAPRQSVDATGGDGDVDLEGAAATTWRLKDLEDAISSLYLYASGSGKCSKQAFERGLAVCDMMITAAAMFPSVERRLSAGLWTANGVPDDAGLHGLQARWPALSTSVQESCQTAFAAPVTVPLAGGKSLKVDNARAAVPLVSFLQHDAKCDARAASLPSLIRSVVTEAELEDLVGVGVGGASSKTCVGGEPTVRLVGAEGRCVDVPAGYYYSGKEVQLYTCKSGSDVNQLWTLKKDGTIRSNGMCLASARNSDGASVVVTDCARCPSSRAVWDVRVDGTVALRSCGLVLSATYSVLWSPGLAVRRDDRGTGQSWTPTNSLTPLATAIVGYRDLCLQVDTFGTVSVAACGGGMEWSLYPDGSLRPPHRLFVQWRCLYADASSGKVGVRVCDWEGSACQRWVFRSDGTILNTGTGMVLDVRPSGHKTDCWDVVVSHALAGKETQKWALKL